MSCANFSASFLKMRVLHQKCKCDIIQIYLVRKDVDVDSQYSNAIIT